MKLESLKELKADLWVFDNDGTLYSNPKVIEKAILALMIGFIERSYRISAVEAVKRRDELLKKHSTKYTLIALRNEGFDEKRFIQETYLSIKPGELGIRKSSKLRNLILSLGGEKVILTNNPSEFAHLILRHLGIDDLFSAIYGMREMGFVQKPALDAFAVLRPFIKQNKKVVFIDDEPENIFSAKILGCSTVLIGEHKKPVGDFYMTSVS